MWKIEKIVKKGDYNYAVVKGHPFATKYGYVLLHRIIMENHLGRILNKNEVVHHINHDKKDNDITNLAVMSAGEHASIHSSEKGRAFLDMKCPQCSKIFSIEKRKSFLCNKGKYKCNCCSKPCRGKFFRKIQLNGLTDEIKKHISENVVREYRKYKL